ncbi:MAG TPA: hypothetical protein VFX12_13285 [Vicinamibacterales bacterium]|nr:hypothetical protein [Vicinamibacterales bacterium]
MRLGIVLVLAWASQTGVLAAGAAMPARTAGAPEPALLLLSGALLLVVASLVRRYVP